MRGPIVPDATLRMLRRLYAARGRWVTTPMLVDAVYGQCEHGGPEWADCCITVFVSRLRKRYGAGIIETARGGGYRVPPGVSLEHVPGLVLDVAEVRE